MATPMADGAHLDPEFVLQHAGFVRSLARGLLRDEALVDDVVQETLVRALEKGPSRREALAAWLRTVTRNIAFKSYRGTARREAREEDAARPERLPATFDLVARGETLERLTAAVLQLPEPAREVVFMRYYEGLSHAEIAERLGIGQGAVRMRVHRAQKTLKESLDRSSSGSRAEWMSSLAVFAGLSAEDLTGSAEPVAASAGLSAAAIAWTAALGLALGGLAWFAGPQLAARESGLDQVQRDVELADVDPRGELVAASARTGREAESLESEDRASSEAALAELGDEEVPAEPFPEGNVVGTVFDAQGEPAAGARIEAAWGRYPMTHRTTANESGRFGLQVPEGDLEKALDGRYAILIAATAAGSAPTRVMAWPEEAEDHPDTEHPHAVLRLRGPGGMLVGTVRGADGGPIRNASIELGERTRLGLGFLGYQSAEVENRLAPLLASRIERGERLTFKGNAHMRGSLGQHVLTTDGHRARMIPARRARTRPDGSFRLVGVEPGVQRLRVAADGHAPWTGFVEIGRDGRTTKSIELDAETTVTGVVRREDGLPLKPTLVHALQDSPWTAATVRVKSDGTFEISGLRAGPLRLVAEERKTGTHTPTRFAANEIDLGAGEVVPTTLVMHETGTRPVRFMTRRGRELFPLAGQRVELRANHNPQLTIAQVVTDDDGRVEVPIDEAVPCSWVLVDAVRAGFAGERDVVAPTRLVEPPPLRRGRDGEAHEEVIEVPAGGTALTSAVLELDLGTSPPIEHYVVLVPDHDLFTIQSWPTSRPNVVEFRSVPPGSYSILVPFHGLGWLSPGTIDVAATPSRDALDLGTLRLPDLGTLELTTATEIEGTRWVDLEIQGRRGDRQVRIFEGRVELPATIPLAPGSYELRTGRARVPYVREVTIDDGQRLEVLWPVD